jgi:hypothetical protein
MSNSSVECDDACKNEINQFYEQSGEYNKKSDPTLKNRILESEKKLNKEYTLLIIWFIITIIVVVITVVGVLSNEMNNYILYISLGFLIFIVFYIFKNLYKYFNI